MKTATATLTSPGITSLFQAAARMDIPADPHQTKPEPPITGEAFAQQRLEAASHPVGRRGGQHHGQATTRIPVSFDTVRLAIFIHSLCRTNQTEEKVRACLT